MDDTKKCTRCQVEKPRSEFYRHVRRADGLSSSCKECEQQYKKKSHVREANRLYYHHNPAYKADVKRRAKIHDETHIEQRRAHKRVYWALVYGKLIRPDACSRCGDDKRRIEGHHPDHSKPLDVIWLCTPCHRIADGVTTLHPPQKETSNV